MKQCHRADDIAVIQFDDFVVELEQQQQKISHESKLFILTSFETVI